MTSSLLSLLDQPAHVLSAGLHASHFSCRELMLATLQRVEETNPVLNAIVSLREAAPLLEEADVCDAMLARGESRGWMHGLPQAIKDLAPTAGLRTTLGSPLMRDFVPKEDGLMVQRMKAAGCIVIGKTNTPEFGLGSHTFNEVFGVTRNAFDPTRSAGGSSGGAAVALAARMLCVADGSDFMGSLRNPAGWNNVFGMRPSQGRVPQWPNHDAWTNQLGTEGPMARNVKDLALLLHTQAGFDARLPLSLSDGARFDGALDAFAPAGVRIGWLGDLDGYLAMEPGILDVCGDALRRLEGIGCAVAPARLGTSPEAVWQAWLVWRRALVATRLAPFLLQPKNRALMKPEALWEYDQAQLLTGQEFTRASAQRSGFYQHMLALLGQHDVLALPVAQAWPFDAQLRWPSHVAGREMDSYHRWMEVVIYATFAGLPCICVPAGFNAEGLPMGLQLIGQPRGDWALLQLARAYEQAAAEIVQRAPIQQAR